MAFTTGYHTQYKSVEKMIRKYCLILLKDSTFSKILPKNTLFIYRKAPVIHNRIAKQVLSPPERPTTIFRKKRFSLDVAEVFPVEPLR